MFSLRVHRRITVCALVVLGGASTALMVLRDGGDPKLSTSLEADLGQIRARPTISRIDLSGIPVRRPLAAYGALWTIVEDRASGSRPLYRVDAHTGAISRVPFGRVKPQYLTAGLGAIWVAGCPHEEPTTNCSDGTVYRVDPATARITDRVEVGSNITSLAADDTAVWVGKWTYVNNVPQPGSLLRLDPQTLALRRYSLRALRTKRRPPCCIRMLAARQGAVWVLFGDDSRLVRLDPKTGVLAQLDAYGSEVSVGEGAVWVEGRTTRLPSPAVEGTLRIDPASGQVLSIGPVAASITAGNGVVWVAETSRDTNDRILKLTRLDPATGQQTGQPIWVEAGPPRIDFAGLPFGWRVQVADASGVLWITVPDSYEAIRITAA